MKGLTRLVVVLIGLPTGVFTWWKLTQMIAFWLGTRITDWHGNETSRFVEKADWIWGGVLAAVVVNVAIVLGWHLAKWIGDGFKADAQERIRRGETEEVGGTLSLPASTGGEKIADVVPLEKINQQR